MTVIIAEVNRRHPVLYSECGRTNVLLQRTIIWIPSVHWIRWKNNDNEALLYTWFDCCRVVLTHSLNRNGWWTVEWILRFHADNDPFIYMAPNGKIMGLLLSVPPTQEFFHFPPVDSHHQRNNPVQSHKSFSSIQVHSIQLLHQFFAQPIDPSWTDREDVGIDNE